jgi:hypothetical protein
MIIDLWIIPILKKSGYMIGKIFLKTKDRNQKRQTKHLSFLISKRSDNFLLNPL